MKSLAHVVFVTLAICFFNLTPALQATDPEAKHPTTTAAQYPVAKPVPGKPKYVFSPYEKRGGYVDVSGYQPGAKVRDPYTGKIFLVPNDSSLGVSSAASAVAPGTYRDWHDVDEVTIIQAFNASRYSQIAVESFDSLEVELPEMKDNTYRAVQSALRTIKPAFIEGLEKKAQRKTGSASAGLTLIVRARLTKVDPGSQAARYWIGYGAGAVKIAVLGELIDGGSGRTLVRFAQERRSGFGMFGGGYSALFQRTARQLGGDVAGLINAF